MATGDGYWGGKGFTTALTTAFQQLLVKITNNSVYVYLNSLISGENTTLNRLMTAPSYSFANYTTNQTGTNAKASAGIFHGISVNAKGTVASSIKVWDGLAGAGTLVCTIDSLNLSGTFLYDATCATGITVTSTGTVAPDFTILYV